MWQHRPPTGRAERPLENTKGGRVVPVPVWEYHAGVARALRRAGGVGATERVEWRGRVRAMTQESPERPPVDRVVCDACHSRVRVFKDGGTVALRCACGTTVEVSAYIPLDWSG